MARASQNDKKTKQATSSAPLTYRQSLEVIGRYFDQHQYRGIFVAEVAEGFVSKGRSSSQTVEGLTFLFDDLRALAPGPSDPPILVADGPPLCPDGYSVFLRAVGERCDQVGGALVSVLEMAMGFVLSYTEPSGGVTVRQRLILDRSAIEALMNDVEDA